VDLVYVVCIQDHTMQGTNNHVTPFTSKCNLVRKG
jgi:hypothetical protein